ncbi:hypothetical protein GCM10020000_58630 [Streptomyces olivoverticillatus]
MVEHLLRAQEAGAEADGRPAVLPQFLGEAERHPHRAVLGEFEEEVAPVVRGVELRRPVRDLHDQPARPPDEQRQRVVAGDEVRLDGEPHHAQARREVHLPGLLVELQQVVAAPHVVDQHVEPPLLPLDAPDELLDLLGHQVVGGHRDAGAARRRDQLRRLLDGLRPADLAAPLARRAPGRVHHGPGLAERHRHGPARSPRGARDQRDLARQWSLVLLALHVLGTHVRRVLSFRSWVTKTTLTPIPDNSCLVFPAIAHHCPR